MITVPVMEFGRYSFEPPIEVPLEICKETVGNVVAGALAVKAGFAPEVVPHYVEGMAVLLDDLALVDVDAQVQRIQEELYDHHVVHA